jgi:L-histidine N-alpha-methyltransferase
MSDRVIGLKARESALDFYDDQHPPAGDFLRDVLDGLARAPKSIPPVYFYDAKGSALFDSITLAPEYYVTRTELALLDAIGPELASLAGKDAVVVEPGSGSSVKIHKLLSALDQPAGYVGLDISKRHLVEACIELAETYPGLAVGAICADFTTGISLDHLPVPQGRRVLFFPGSTIGNFEPEAARDVLAGFRKGMRPGDALLIGADRVKDEATLVAAYDDAGGTSAAFNLNLITRINKELGGTIPAGSLEHLSVWNAEHARIEMHLEALERIEFEVGGHSFSMEKGERLHTENSHKFTPDTFDALARSAGFKRAHSWSDPAEFFSLHWLEPDDKA